jgi:hypothetical protein
MDDEEGPLNVERKEDCNTSMKAVKLKKMREEKIHITQDTRW